MKSTINELKETGSNFVHQTMRGADTGNEVESVEEIPEADAGIVRADASRAEQRHLDPSSEWSSHANRLNVPLASPYIDSKGCFLIQTSYVLPPF